MAYLTFTRVAIVKDTDSNKECKECERHGRSEKLWGDTSKSQTQN